MLGLASRKIKSPAVERLDAPISGELTRSQEDVQDRIVLIRTNLPVEDTVIKLQKKGAKAAVVMSLTFQVAGFLKYRINNYTALPEVLLPVLELGVNHSRLIWSLIDSDQISNITILPDEFDNPWTEAFSSDWFYVYEVVLGLYSLADIGVAAWRMKVFINFYGGWKSSIALYVLLIEIFSNILRISALVDHFGYNGLYTDWASVTFSELCFPFVVASFMLFSLFWHELMTNASVVVHPFIQKMRIPFFVASGAFLALQIIRAIIRGLGALENSSLISSVLYLVVALALVLFYAITGIKLLKRLHEIKSKGRAVNLNKTTIRILISSAFILFFVILGGIFASGLPYRPIGYIVTWFVLYSIMDTASLMNILACELPNAKTSSGSKGNSSTSGKFDRSSAVNSGNSMNSIDPTASSGTSAVV